MKKVFISLLLVILVCSPVFAGNLQNQYEAEHRFYDNADFCKKFANMMIKDDYETYLTNGDSMYGRAVKLRQKYKENNLSNDVKYLDIALSQYRTNLKVINIDDSIYQYLQLDTKNFISFYNSLARLYNAKIEF